MTSSTSTHHNTVREWVVTIVAGIAAALICTLGMVLSPLLVIPTVSILVVALSLLGMVLGGTRPRVRLPLLGVSIGFIAVVAIYLIRSYLLFE